MQKWSWLFLLALLSAVASGCAAARYQVQVNGYTDSVLPAPVAPGASFFVMENPEAKNPLLEKEIMAKIGKLLTTQGYSLSPSEKADYCLKFAYGMGNPQAAVVTKPSVGLGFGLGYGRWGPGPYWGSGVYWPGYWPYSTETVPLFDRWLQVSVAEGKHYRTTGKFNPIWVGEARSIGTSSDFREVVNFLLIATFEQFGKNTGKAVPAEISRNDPRFKELEGVR